MWFVMQWLCGIGTLGRKSRVVWSMESECNGVGLCAHGCTLWWLWWHPVGFIK